VTRASAGENPRKAQKPGVGEKEKLVEGDAAGGGDNLLGGRLKKDSRRDEA